MTLALATARASLKIQVQFREISIKYSGARYQSEHDAFVQEQLDFDNAIAACGKAAELLTAHYGDGTPPPRARDPRRGVQGGARTQGASRRVRL